MLYDTGQLYAETYNSVLPRDSALPRGNQLYFVETDGGKVMRQEQWAKTRISILGNLLNELNNVNPLAKPYKTMFNYMAANPVAKCSLVFAKNMAKVAGVNRGVAHHPTGTEVAAIYTTVDDINGADLVLRPVKDDSVRRLSSWNPLADAVLFPLIFMHGEIGYHPKNNMRVSNVGRKTEVGVQEWHVHRVFERADKPQMAKSGKLFQQYVVASWIRVEDCRLHRARNNQETLRVET